MAWPSSRLCAWPDPGCSYERAFLSVLVAATHQRQSFKYQVKLYKFCLLSIICTILLLLDPANCSPYVPISRVESMSCL